jgi:hypothetical protein
MEFKHTGETFLKLEIIYIWLHIRIFVHTGYNIYVLSTLRGPILSGDNRGPNPLARRGAPLDLPCKMPFSDL